MESFGFEEGIFTLMLERMTYFSGFPQGVAESCAQSGMSLVVAPNLHLLIGFVIKTDFEIGSEVAQACGGLSLFLTEAEVLSEMSVCHAQAPRNMYYVLPRGPRAIQSGSQIVFLINDLKTYKRLPGSAGSFVAARQFQ